MARRLAIFFLLALLGPTLATAQEAQEREDVVPADTIAADTLRIVPTDFGERAPRSSGEGSLENPVEFTAADSLVIEFDDEIGDRGSLFGKAKVNSGDAELEAYRVDILFDRNELRASGLPSDTGLVGRPRFSQGQEAFHGRELAFNLQTQRGRVVGAQTSIQEGFVRAEVVKVGEDSTLYVSEGAYTTCECVDDPSYSLRSDKMKIVDQEWIYTGPIQLYLFNIPTPLWLPFGFLPAKEGRRSGPLPPRYGEDERGFYLRGWGWYQAISEYMDAQVQFGLWTRGSWQLNPQFRYARRYHYGGELNVDYVRNRRGERDDPDFTEMSTSSLRWNHRQELSPTSQFNANVNLSSQNYLRTISERYDDRVRQTVQSSVRYNKNWQQSGRSLSLDLNHREQLSDGAAQLTLPSLRFNQSSRKPFDLESTTGNNERWFEKITYTYNNSLDNRYDFRRDPTLVAGVDTVALGISWTEALFSPSKYRRATGQAAPFDTKASHQVRSSASFTVNRIPLLNTALRLYVSPNLDYSEDWYLRTERMRYDSTARRNVRESVSDPTAIRQFSTGVSANTTFYGIFPFRLGPFVGFRHTVRPSLGFNYQPDFYDEFWGYTREFVNSRGETERYNIVSGVRRGEQKALSLNLSNVFETKRASTDTTGTQPSRPIQFLNVDMNTAYNFAAEEFKLADLRFSARTRIAEKLDIRFGGAFSPYSVDSLGRPVDRLLVLNNYFRPLRLTQFNVSFNTSFRSDQRGESRPFGATGMRQAGMPMGLDQANPFDVGDPIDAQGFGSSVGYADFAIPWSLDVDFSYNLSKAFGPARRSATVNTGFGFNLTPNWRVQGRSGYDLIEREIVLTNVSILRDFECWEMGISWVPFGPYQSYSFDLHVKSGHLRDILRLRQPRADVRGRFGNLID